MAKRITDRVTWVGKTDWELKHFHGNELSTHRGSSYNSYLVRGSEKTVLIDTVWQPFDHEFVARLREETDLSRISAVIMQHNESDHSGALPELMRHLPGVPIYCTKKGEAIIRGHYHPQDWNFVNVKTGDKLSLGDVALTFIEAAMLHWPDTMFTYMRGEEILFSNDGFGQHYATESLYNDCVDTTELMYEAEKYYANILAPYSQMALRKINEILAMQLPIRLICPSHGVIWKNNPEQIVLQYLKWADNYRERQVTFIYDTMWNSTRIMAEQIAAGILQTDPTITIRIMNAAKDDKNDILTQAFHSSAILVGSPTVNNGCTYAIAGILEMLHGMKLKKKKAAAFGSYGWGGEAVKQISAGLAASGFEVVNEGCRCQWVPDQTELKRIRSYGAAIAGQIAP